MMTVWSVDNEDYIPANCLTTYMLLLLLKAFNAQSGYKVSVTHIPSYP